MKRRLNYIFSTSSDGFAATFPSKGKAYSYHKTPKFLCANGFTALNSNSLQDDDKMPAAGKEDNNIKNIRIKYIVGFTDA